MPERSPAELVRSAARGDRAAWDEIVERYHRLVWSVARGFRLDQADAADVSQTTWLRLVENLPRIKDPDNLPAWLATTARRECIRLLRRNRREVPGGETFDTASGHQVDPDSNPETAAVSSEERRDLWTAYRQLGERCQLLLRVLAVAPLESYAEVARAMGMPIGSIGPTRSRCLAQLRRLLVQLCVVSGPADRAS